MQCGMQIELSSVVQFANKNFLDLTSTGKVFACSVREKNKHYFVMKGYYENFCFEVYKVPSSGVTLITRLTSSAVIYYLTNVASFSID